MATKYAVVSGLWSSTATWSNTDGGAGGAAVPADTNAIVISAGVNVLADVDTSGFAAGLYGITVRGGSTPGMLYCYNGYSSTLKIATGYNIVGTTVTNKGRLLCNSDGVWGNTGTYSFANKFIISMLGTAQITATNFDINLRNDEPNVYEITTYYDRFTISSINASTDVITLSGTHGWVADRAVKFKAAAGGVLPAGVVENCAYFVNSPSGATLKLRAGATDGPIVDFTDSGSGTVYIYSGYETYAGVTTVNVFEDISSNQYWGTTAGHNAVLLQDDQRSSSTQDQQFVTLTAKTSSTVTLGTALDSAQYPGAKIILQSRNISIQSGSTSSSQAIIDSATGCYFGCEIKNTSGTVSYSRGLNNSNNNTVTNIAGCNNGIYNGSNNTVTNIAGCNTGIYGNNNTVTNIAGCNNGIYNGNINTVTNIAGCNTVAYNGNNGTITNIAGCNTGLNNSSNNTVTNIAGTATIATSSCKNNIIKSGDASGYTTIQQTSQTSKAGIVLEDCTLAGVSRMPFRAYLNSGDVRPLIASDTTWWQTPPSGNSWISQMLPNSYNTASAITAGAILANQMEYSLLNPMAVYADSATSKTLTVKAYPVGWSASLDQDDLVLEVSYLDSASGNSRTTVYNASQTYANNGWRDVSVTFTPGQAGIVYFQLYLRSYYSGAYVLIDPAWGIA